MLSRGIVIQDALYGPISLPSEIAALALTPVIQRLRHVRLSNIDSMDMPGIANLSRYEHVLGVAYLAQQAGLAPRLSQYDKLVLQAAALMHDWAITAFGHLVEEALQYVGTGFDHERRLKQIVDGETPEEIIGVDRQILGGRQTGLGRWATKVSGSRGQETIAAIRDHIVGEGAYGKLISSELDLDNADNLFRIAWHMGLAVDRETPVRLARAIVDVDEDRNPIFLDSAKPDIDTWCEIRERVYTRLMLAPSDFAGKLMILYAAVKAFEAGEISVEDWAWNDHQFLERLLTSSRREVRETVTRWMAGELWSTTPLVWMSGARPPYTDFHAFSLELKKLIKPDCFAYGIKDKRNRLLNIRFENAGRHQVGTPSSQWLFGVGISAKRHFTTAESKKVIDFASAFFSCEARSVASQPFLSDSEPCLF